MIEYKKSARFAGAMFLLAMVASLTGGILIQNVISKPDFMNAILLEKEMIIIGVVLEILNALAVIGITAALWMPLKSVSPSMIVGYLGVRVIESVSCVAAALIPILLITLGMQDSNNNTVPFANSLNVVRDGIVAYAIPLFFGIGGLLLYIMLYRSMLVPRYISVWGMIAALAVMVNMFVPATAMKPLLALPIIINEIYLGVYLLIKGVCVTATHSGNKHS